MTKKEKVCDLRGSRLVGGVVKIGLHNEKKRGWVEYKKKSFISRTHSAQHYPITTINKL